MATVHVIRHGEVENPQKILYGRQPGWRLSDRGQEMAQVIAQWSQTIDVGALHVSPLQRAQETAQPISEVHKLKITTDERLIEASNVFEGKAFGIGEQFGSEFYILCILNTFFGKFKFFIWISKFLL